MGEFLETWIPSMAWISGLGFGSLTGFGTYFVHQSAPSDVPLSSRVGLALTRTVQHLGRV